jgi:hypothetical protein
MQKTIEIIHHIIYDNNKGGLGLMVRHTQGNSFIELATSYCSLDDQYSKKIAVARLQHCFDEGMFIQLPMLIPGLRSKMTHRDLRDILNVAIV